MSRKTLAITDEIHEYLLSATLREPEVFRRLRAETAELLADRANMQIAPEQGQFMRLLVELTGAANAIEIGTFTGYSALCIASGLPEDGRLLCCDVSEEFTAVARRYWDEAGLSDRIALRIAPALETLDALIAEGRAGEFDFAFIDADKENTAAYYERCLTLLRPGGLIAIDNALAGGRVAKPAEHPAVQHMIDANRMIQQDERVTMSLATVGDGLMLARKR